MKLNTRKLTLLSIIFSFWLVIVLFQMTFGIPIMSVIIALVAPILGMKRAIAIRLLLTTISFLFRMDIVLLFFQINIMAGLLLIPTIYLTHLTLFWISHRILQKWLIF